jgi:hypothetical protein
VPRACYSTVFNQPAGTVGRTIRAFDHRSWAGTGVEAQMEDGNVGMLSEVSAASVRPTGQSGSGCSCTPTLIASMSSAIQCRSQGHAARSSGHIRNLVNVSPRRRPHR